MMLVFTIVIDMGFTTARIRDKPKLITAANTTGLPKQPRALLKLLRQLLPVHQPSTRNIIPIVTAEITMPLIASMAADGKSSSINRITKITAVIKAKKAAAAMLKARLIKPLLSYNIF